MLNEIIIRIARIQVRPISVKTDPPQESFCEPRLWIHANFLMNPLTSTLRFQQSLLRQSL